MNQTSPNPSRPEPYDYVNPLYGPGSVIGWYLTMIATALAWSFHRSRSRSDSIDADFMISLTLPVFAVAHLLNLSRRTDLVQMVREKADLNAIPAINGPSYIIVGGAGFTVIASLCAGVTAGFKRSTISSIVGILCAATSGVISFKSNQDIGTLIGVIVATSCVYTIAPVIAWASCQCGDDMMKMVVVKFLRNKRLQHMNSNAMAVRIRNSLHAVIIILATVSFLPVFFVGSRTQFSHTGTSLIDLDQMAAAIGGATVLVFNMYSIVRGWHSKLKQRRLKKLEGHAELTNGIALSTVRTQYVIDPDPEQNAQADAESALDVGDEPLSSFEPEPELELQLEHEPQPEHERQPESAP